MKFQFDIVRLQYWHNLPQQHRDGLFQLLIFRWCINAGKYLAEHGYAGYNKVFVFPIQMPINIYL